MQVTRKTLDQVLGSPKVRAALRQQAARVQPKARQLALGAGALEFAKRLRVVEGVRPGTKAVGGVRRPYARVVADMPEEARQADARAKLTRRQILRRASR